jgi:hypothetical protein
MSFWHGVRSLPLVALLSAALPLAAQAQQQQQDASPRPTANQPAKDGPATPKDLLDALLGGAPGAMTDATKFLISGDRRPEEVARRATALISEIGARRAGVGTDTLLRVIDRIASDAISMVAGSQIVRLAVDKDFVPRNAVVAWDFGSPDAGAARGFEKVRPGDPRIGGAALNALRRPGEDNVLQDGITGVERIEADVPDGDYRIILMTQNLGDSKLMANPFGSELVINGVSVPVAQPNPTNWVPGSVFSNSGAQNVGAQGGPAGLQGISSGDISRFDQDLSRQQGGAIILNAKARGGKLIIELKGFQNASSYLTGLVVEPANQPSNLILSPQAVQVLTPVEVRLALEENILASAASVLAQVNPDEGIPELVDLPDPILDPEENASTSS